MLFIAVSAKKQKSAIPLQGDGTVIHGYFADLVQL